MTAGAASRLGLGLTLALAVVIGVLTLQPLPEIATRAPGSDKLHHLLAFAALVLPATAARPRHALWLLPLAIGYGGAIELIQPHVGRHGEWGDVLANSLGALIGVALGVALNRLLPIRPG